MLLGMVRKILAALKLGPNHVTTAELDEIATRPFFVRGYYENSTEFRERIINYYIERDQQ